MPKKSYKPSKFEKGSKSKGKQSWDNKDSEVIDTKKIIKGRQLSKPNDWTWYAQNEQLLRDSASFPYSWPLGRKLNLGRYAPEVNKGSIAGICTIHISPTFGWDIDATSPINTAARMVYTYVRHMNSGHTNYDSPDLMLYLMAVDSLYSFHAWMRRVYGTISSWSYTNRYLAKPLIEAQGVDYDNLVENLADYRRFVNQFASQIAKFAVPSNMSYMAKHTWMYSGLYLDSDQPKAQTYLFNPHGFYRFELQNDAGALKFYELLPIPTHYPEDKRKLLKLDEIIAYARNLAAPIFSSEDMAIMGGDILKAYGASNCAVPPTIDDGFFVAAVYDEEVLDQIQNASLIGDWAFPPSLVQSDAKDYLIFNPQFTHPYTFDVQGEEFPGQNVFLSDRILTFNRSVVDPSHTMEASRLTNICTEFEEAGTQTYLCKTLGSEVAHAATIYWNVDDNESGNASTTTWSNPIYIGLTHVIDLRVQRLSDLLADYCQQRLHMTESDAKAWADQFFKGVANSWWYDVCPGITKALMQDARLVQQLSQFDRHFPVAVTTGVQGSENLEKPAAYGRYVGQILDVNYNTVLSERDLMNMADTALLSEFNVTNDGKWS